MSHKNRKRGHRNNAGGQLLPRAGAVSASESTTSAPPSLPTATTAPRAPRLLGSDQRRALLSYAWAREAREQNVLNEYTIAVQGFAGALLRGGFAVAASVLEREAKPELEQPARPGFRLLLEHLASHGLPSVPAGEASAWAGKVRSLADLCGYMLATREMIALLSWLRRACRALGGENAP